ncbi:MAG TPA: colanic acid biosynthesis glycosyltransferase WcaL [Rhodospirillales bacterium]|nr:colanic acid biosynthesis glycosyltransferase WcaL [Rhodospirillales bacterium]
MRAAIILKGYPRLSETFIAQEILELQKRGLSMEIVSLRYPTDNKKHPIHDEIVAPVRYLPEYLYKEIGRVWTSWRRIRRWTSYRDVLRVWLRDLRRDLTSNRIRRFGQALVLASELKNDVDHLHAHFLHTPASVTRYAANLLGISWSCSAHAVDIWTTPKWEVREKLENCKWLVTCTRGNERYLKGLAENPLKIHLVYHGLDLEKFKVVNRKIERSSCVRLLSVGRAVEKKGYKDLLAALALLPDNLDWTFTHIGGGAELKQLKRMTNSWDVPERIKWIGPCSQEEVIKAYRDADIFVLASKIAKNGDRDGLPNVLIEAQSQGLPCVSTRLSGIPEFIEDEVSGLLADPGDIEGLSARLHRLIVSAELRASLGTTGQNLVRANFNFHNCVENLTLLFGLPAKNGIDNVA